MVGAADDEAAEVFVLPPKENPEPAGFWVAADGAAGDWEPGRLEAPAPPKLKPPEAAGAGPAGDADGVDGFPKLNEGVGLVAGAEDEADG